MRERGCFFGEKRKSDFSLSFGNEKGYADLGIDQIVEKFQSEKKALENVLSNQQQSAETAFNQLLIQSEKTDSLTVDQFKRSFESMKLSVDEINQLVNEVDKNHNGTVGKFFGERK